MLIEGKLGLIKLQSTRERIDLPVLSETVICTERMKIFFESDMKMEYHSMYNQLLNFNVNPGSKIKYVHKKEIDQFIKVEGVGTVRRTIDDKNQVFLH
jgi:hypothetical protein